MEQEQEGELPSPGSNHVLLEGQDKASEHRINIIDTPGHVDLPSKSSAACVCSTGVHGIVRGRGVKPQTETVWRQANKYAFRA